MGWPRPIKRHLKNIFGVKSTSDPNSVQKLTIIANKNNFLSERCLHFQINLEGPRDSFSKGEAPGAPPDVK